MKTMKKLLSIAMVLALVLSLGVSAFAADINITDEHSAGSEYRAYRLLDLTVTADAKEDSSGYAYSVNPKYLEALKTATGKTTEKDIIDYLGDEGTDIRAFADTIYPLIKDMTADYGPTASKEIKGVEQGYYLIAETVANGSVDSAASLVMLDTAGNQNVNVTTKEDIPTSEKKVMETNDTTGNKTGWQDAADYDIGDHVPYQLKATIQNSEFDAFDSYSLKFVDTLSKGLTFDTDSVKVYVDGAEVSKDYFTVSSAAAADVEGDYAGGTVVTFTCEDIKAIESVKAGSVITIEYTATLNTGAVVGADGNPNKMHIEYSNNPYGEGTGETKDDIVTVFTFTVEAKKVDGENKALAGAAFTLFKKVPAGTDTTGATVYESLEEDGEPVELHKGDFYKVGEDLYQVVGEPVTPGADTTFTFKGQDSGDYLLVETTVPAGYNKADDMAFTVKATYQDEAEDPALTGLEVTPAELEFTCTLATGVASVTVQNLTGMELPETGGIGTTIFYVAGAILVAGAVVLLVTKKRMTGSEK